MINLLKYDFKRNANLILAGAAILVLAQAALMLAGWWRDWDGQILYIGIMVIYVLFGFLAYLMMCQTYNGNIRSYSRRLLPLGSWYLPVSPFLLLVICYLALGAMFVLFDTLFSLIFDVKDTLFSMLRQFVGQIGFWDSAAMTFNFLWELLFITVAVFMAITVARTIDGKGGTFMGIAAFITLFALIVWIESLLFPQTKDDSSWGIVSIEINEGAIVSGAISKANTSFDWGLLLFELAIVAALYYAILYMLDRKVKL